MSLNYNSHALMITFILLRTQVRETLARHGARRREKRERGGIRRNGADAGTVQRRVHQGNTTTTTSFFSSSFSFVSLDHARSGGCFSLTIFWPKSKRFSETLYYMSLTRHRLSPHRLRNKKRAFASQGDWRRRRWLERGEQNGGNRYSRR